MGLPSARNVDIEMGINVSGHECFGGHHSRKSPVENVRKITDYRAI